MGKIKQFIEDHKKVVIGTIVGVGGAAVCIATYNIGFKKGFKQTTMTFMAMIDADLDGTAMFVEKYLGDRVDDKELIALGNDIVREVSN